MSGGSGVRQTSTNYVSQQPVSSTYTTSNYVGSGSGVGQTTYVSQPATTTYVNQPGTTYTTTEYVNQPATSYSTTEYVNQPGYTSTTEYVNQPGTTTTYSTSNYNQGGTTYVSGGSGVRNNATYETTTVNRAY